MLLSRFCVFFFPKSRAASRGFLVDACGMLSDTYSIGILIRPVGGFESVTSAMTFNAALIVFPVLGIFNPQIFSVNESPLNDSVSINAQESVWQLFSTVALLALTEFIMC